VYGPWGRPDMALFLFTKAILSGHQIDVFNNGEMMRDFTYIDDIVEGIVRLLFKPPTNKNELKGEANKHNTIAPWQVFNIGNNDPVQLMDFIHAIEEEVNKKAIMNLLPLQPGDVAKTYADVSKLKNYVGYRPQTSIKYGINKFVTWYRNYYKV
jgi:UDP-glucuronate 4-epimerase